jgi:hypothetical protein
MDATIGEGTMLGAPVPPYLERRLLIDPTAERELCDLGYTVIDLLSPDEVASLYSFYASHADRGDLNPEGAYNPEFAEFTTMNSRSDFRRDAFEHIATVVTPRTAEHLVDCRPVVANFVNKPPGGGIVPVHQNMSVADETTGRSVSVWIALVDCGDHNGTIEVAPGSHHRFRGRRGTWAYQEFGHIESDVIARHFEAISIRAGQAVVLDDALIHWSPPNHHDERRLAIQLVMVPAELDALYFQVAEEHEDDLDLDVLAVEPPFFFDFWGGVGSNEHAHLVDRVTIPRVVHDSSAFGADPVAAPAGGAPTDPGPHEAAAPMPQAEPTPHRTLGTRMKAAARRLLPRR